MAPATCCNAGAGPGEGIIVAVGAGAAPTFDIADSETAGLYSRPGSDNANGCRKMVALMDLDAFGAIDADADGLLDECFENHEAYKSAVRHERYLLLGRKGSGKTAIFKKIIKTRAHDVFSFGHTFSDYPWHHHERQKAQGTPEEQCFMFSWEYLILITLCKILLNQDNSQPWNDLAADSLATIEKFVVDTYGSRDPDVSSIFSPVHVLRFHPSLKINAKFFTAGISPEACPMDYLPRVFPEVNENVRNHVIRSLNPSNNYYVCFDELDLGFNVTDENYLVRLIGLLLASRKINLSAKEASKRLSIVTFLRDDIYDRLQFEDKNKITQNAAAVIEWDTTRTRHTLKNLIAKRFAKLLGYAENEAWNLVVDEESEMRGRQTKYKHILDRTVLRPRDIIKFSNEVLIAYKARGGSNRGKFENRDVQQARDRYSEYLLNELDDEIHKHIPDYKKYIEVIKTVGRTNFAMVEFIEACQDRGDILGAESEANTILRRLFEFSVVGYYRPGGAGYGGAEYVWRYKDPSAQFNENAQSFRVHYGFKETLDLREGQARRAA